MMHIPNDLKYQTIKVQYKPTSKKTSPLKEYTDSALPILLRVEQLDSHPKTASSIGYYHEARKITA